MRATKFFGYFEFQSIQEKRYAIINFYELKEEFETYAPIKADEIPQRLSLSGWMSTDFEAEIIQQKEFDMPFEIENNVPIPSRGLASPEMAELVDALSGCLLGQSVFISF